MRVIRIKAMLHEAIFLATCNATFVALQVARKYSRVTPHFATDCNCCFASCKKSRTTLYFSQRYETSCLRHVTSPLQLQRFLFVIPLQVARKIALCNMAFISKSTFDSRSDPIFKELELLKLSDIRELELGKSSYVFF